MKILFLKYLLNFLHYRIKCREMERRIAIRNFLILSAGVGLLPSCHDQVRPSTITLKNFQITRDQEKLLASMTETLLPTTISPGAGEIGAHSFVLTMVDDCFTKKDRDQFVRGLNEFSDFTMKNLGEKFDESGEEKKNGLINEFETKKLKPGSDMVFFYATVKRLTLQAYMSSKYYLTQVQKYQLIPGPFHGCVPVSSV
jgi:hypothetical protein